MLFLTTVKFCLSSISFKALIVVNSFRNREGLGIKSKLRTWERESSQESASSLSAVGRSEIGHFITDRLTDRGSRRQNIWIGGNCGVNFLLVWLSGHCFLFQMKTKGRPPPRGSVHVPVCQTKVVVIKPRLEESDCTFWVPLS